MSLAVPPLLELGGAAPIKAWWSQGICQILLVQPVNLSPTLWCSQSIDRDVPEPDRTGFFKDCSDRNGSFEPDRIFVPDRTGSEWTGFDFGPDQTGPDFIHDWTATDLSDLSDLYPQPSLSPIYSHICIHAHVSCIFMDVSIASAASPAHTHPSIKGAALHSAPLSWIPLWMDVSGLVRQQMRWKHL